MGMLQLVGAGVLACALAGCEAEAPPAPEAARPLRVVTVEPTKTAVAVTLTGSLAAQVDSNLAFRTGGQIVERLVDVGDKVVRDQLLARIEPKIQLADVESAKAAVAAAEAEAKRAAAAFARSETLLGRGFTTRRDFEAADRALKVAQADQTSAEAGLASATEQLAFAEMRAPSDGIVVARELDVGETAQAASTVFTIALDGPRDAVFDLYEGLLLQGEPPKVVVALAADPSVVTAGTVRQISPTVDPDSGTVRVKIGLEAVPAAMTLGAAVTGSATLPAQEVVVLPSAAMTASDGAPAVWVVDPATGTVSMRKVLVQSYDAATVAVAGGLSAGEQVVVQGTKLLRPGQRIAAGAEMAR